MASGGGEDRAGGEFAQDGAVDGPQAGGRHCWHVVVYLRQSQCRLGGGRLFRVNGGLCLIRLAKKTTANGIGSWL